MTQYRKQWKNNAADTCKIVQAKYVLYTERTDGQIEDVYTSY